MRFYILPFLLLGCMAASAQDTLNKWSLRKCVDYAVANNLTVKQSYVQRFYSDIDLHQSRMTKLPTLNGSVFAGYSFGLSENQTTGTLSSENIFQVPISLQGNYTIFNWFARKNTIESNRIALEAAKAGIEKAQNDISLSVANTFLQAMLGSETVKIAEVQLQQVREQLGNTEKLVRAGSLPELNAIQLQAQVALDSANLIQAQSSYRQAIIQLKTLLNLPQDTSFQIIIPPVESIPVDPLSELEPAYVYSLALTNQPLQKINTLRLQQSGFQAKAARGAMYPVAFAQGSLSTAFANLGRRVAEGATVTYVSSTVPPLVNVSGTNYPVLFPTVAQEKDPFFSQLNRNFGQRIGVGISFNIFNQHQLRSQWNRAKVQVEQYKIQQQQDNATLQADIYNAYELAIAALQRYQATVRQVEMSEQAVAIADKRYAIGMLGVLDQITTRNNLLRAKIEMVRNRYDYVFKMKVLEYYKGNGIKL